MYCHVYTWERNTCLYAVSGPIRCGVLQELEFILSLPYFTVFTRIDTEYINAL